MKIAVYTAITAGKDSLKEPRVPEEGVDWIFFTDRPQDYAGTAWNIRSACSLFTDPRRNSRAHKILSHQYVPDYDCSLWIDGSTVLLTSAIRLAETYLADADVAMFRHPARSCIYVEAAGCAEARYDARETFDDQVAKYRRAGYPADNGLNECTVILRRHNARTEVFNNAWWAEYCRYSCRDQVSMNYVAHTLGIKIALFPGDLRNNPGIVGHGGHLR